MKKIRIKNAFCNIDKIEAMELLRVWYEKDWDGGDIWSMSLKEKSEFYHDATQLSMLLFDIFSLYNEEEIVIGPFFYGSNYCAWKNLNKIDLIKYLKKQLKPKQYLSLNCQKDITVIENVIEANMRYLTRICVMLPFRNVLIEIGHHTSFLIYSEDCDSIVGDMGDLLGKYTGWHCEQVAPEKQ